MTIVVSTPARLHLGLLDTNGDLGRLYGSIGVAIERPNFVLEAEIADRLLVDGLEAERVATFARRFLGRYPLPHGARLRLRVGIPPHVGLGSGTQLALAVGTALARLGGLKLGAAEIALATGRGVHSGIGIGAFQHGGFVLDGGHRVARTGQAAEADQRPVVEVGRAVPPVLLRHPFPEDWYFVVAVPRTETGLSGEREQRAFREMPPASATLVERISRLLLMGMLPALMERDIIPFGRALTEIQRLVGDCFAAVQGRQYANPVVEQLIGHMLDKGVAGAGQSSWGPTVYALVKGEGEALALEREVQGHLACLGGGRTFCTRGDNRGARIRRIHRGSEGAKAVALKVAGG